MGNCVDKGDGGSGADHKGAGGIAGLLDGKEHEFETKNDAGKVTCKITADKKFELAEFEGDGAEAKTTWKGDITEADGKFTFDASGDDATTGEPEKKTFEASVAESGALNLGHKFIGDIEEITPKGEAAAGGDEEKKDEE